MDPSSVTVILPTVDEAATIEAVASAVRSHGYRVLIVDDASTDGTAAIAADLAGRDEGISVIHRPAKAGLGTAYAAGFSAATNAEAKVVCEMDSDLQHDPSALPSLVDAVSKGADLAIGSRFVEGGRIQGWSASRRWLSRWGNRYARAMLGVPVRDLTSGYRAIRVGALDMIDAASCRAQGYGFQVETTLRAHRGGLRIVEVPITFGERRSGASKFDGAVVREAMRLVTLWGVGRALRRGPAASRPSPSGARARE